MKLRDSGILADLSIGLAPARKFDKKETAVIAQRHGTAAGVLRLNKRLYTASEAYKAITAAGSHLRDVFKRNTLPWDDEGRRLLVGSNYIPATQEFLKAESAFNATIPPFVEQFPFLKAHDKNILNGLFREEDYPSIDKLKKKFYVRFEYEAIPEAEDIRCDLRDEDIKAIRDSAKAAVERKMARAMEEPYARLFDGVAHMASRLQGLKECPCRNCHGKTYSTDQVSDSLVDNLRGICDILPRLNFAKDPELDRLVQSTVFGLTQFEPDLIRDSKTVRQTLAERAAALQAELAPFMRAA